MLAIKTIGSENAGVPFLACRGDLGNANRRNKPVRQTNRLNSDDWEVRDNVFCNLGPPGVVQSVGALCIGFDGIEKLSECFAYVCVLKRFPARERLLVR
jgi:hypothetical protein